MKSMTTPVRTRFAPSPTGFLHIGGARTALFSWAFARHFGGKFILRVEDTDVARSSQEAVQGIIEGMAWLGLNHDEGPFFQMQRLDRYKDVVNQMIRIGTAYHCYSSPDELDEMREAQKARGEKARYDGRWRPENLNGRKPPEGVSPVVRFKNPVDGVVTWKDLIKGEISIANQELDDLIIARSDGTPTYNFCVVVDDMDMAISHVIRGDDHVNNTPRQINILKALGSSLPEYGHVPMIHGDDGQKLSKRHGAVSVMQYHEDGFLPDAVINYLARLGWSHGNDEIFGRQQLLDWFDGTHLSQSPSQFDTSKLKWLNQQYLIGAAKADPASLVPDLYERLSRRGVSKEMVAAAGIELPVVVVLLAERSQTLEELADQALMFFSPAAVSAEDTEKHLTPNVLSALTTLKDSLAICEWNAAGISDAIKGVVASSGLKMPQIAVPLRLKVFGKTQTPSIDATLAAMKRDAVLQRL
jgi:glutamyl-tRNA synthetase